MHICSFDIVGPLKTSYRGNSYYLSWIEHFSQWPEAIPLSATDQWRTQDFRKGGGMTSEGAPPFQKGPNLTYTQNLKTQRISVTISQGPILGKKNK